MRYSCIHMHWVNVGPKSGILILQSSKLLAYVLQMTMSVTGAGVAIDQFKVKPETPPGQKSSLVSCMVTSFSALQIHTRNLMIAR